MKMKKVFSKVVTFLMVFTFVFGAIGVITPEKVKAAENYSNLLPVGNYIMTETIEEKTVSKKTGAVSWSIKTADFYVHPELAYSDELQVMFKPYIIELEKTDKGLTANLIVSSKAFTIYNCAYGADKLENKIEKTDIIPAGEKETYDYSGKIPSTMAALNTIKSKTALYKYSGFKVNDDFSINIVTVNSKGEVKDSALFIDASKVYKYTPESLTIGDKVELPAIKAPVAEPKVYAPKGEPKELANGLYNIEYFNATSGANAAMFSLLDVKINVRDGAIFADIAMKDTTGYDAIYLGKSADKDIEDKKIVGVIKTIDVNGTPTKAKVFENVAISALDEKIELACHSKKNEQWYSRAIYLDSSTAVAVTTKKTIEPEKTTTDIAFKAADEGNSSEIQLKTGSVEFDATAVKELIEATGGAAVTITLDEVTESTTFKDKGYDKVISIKLTATDGTPLFTKAANGKATITIPYDKAVEEGKTVKVYYVTDGKEEEVEATYDADAKTVTFTLAHFSEYAIKQVDATDATTTADAPKTGDNSMVALIAIIMLMAGATVVTMRRKRA